MPHVQDAAAVPAGILTVGEFWEVLMLLLASVNSHWNKTVHIPIRKMICYRARLMITVSNTGRPLLLTDSLGLLQALDPTVFAGPFNYAPLYRNMARPSMSILHIPLEVLQFPKSITHVPRLLLTVSVFSV